MSYVSRGKEEDEVPPPQRPPSPPPHTTFAARGIHPPNFSAFKPRDYKTPCYQGITHVAWNCDGKRLAGVGMDKQVRIWYPEQSPIDLRSCQMFQGGHTDDIDHMSWNPIHPDLFVTSSQKDKKLVFWDTRQKTYIQTLQFSKILPVSTTWSPDGRTVLWTSAGRQTYVLGFGQREGETRESWSTQTQPHMIHATQATFSNAGDLIVTNNAMDHTIKVMEFPSLKLVHTSAAHVAGCTAVALDPRGRYLASGGNDSIINMFDLEEWICARTITTCDHAITGLSFSYDGEYLAISNAGNYIDIVAAETAMPIHRISTLGSSPTVQWHPSKYVFAYCGHHKPKQREGGPPGGPPQAFVSLFGPGMSI